MSTRLPHDAEPPCLGLLAIFDSSAAADHRMARRLCAGGGCEQGEKEAREDARHREGPEEGCAATCATCRVHRHAMEAELFTPGRRGAIADA